MKKSLFLLIACLILLVGCENAIGEPFIMYNGEIYDFHNWTDWNLINEDAEWETIYVWHGFEEEFSETIKYTTKAKTLKDDPNRLIIAYGVMETNYYIKRGAIPAVYSDSVEKIVLSNEVSNLTLDKEGLELWLDFLKQCYSDKNHVSEKWNKGVPNSSIYVYFSDFPMNYYYGYFGLSESGRLGFSSWDFENYNTHCIILPEELSSRILGLGYQN